MRGILAACAIAIAIPRVAAADGVGVIAAGGGAGVDRRAVARAMASAVGEGRPARVVVDAVGEARSAIAAGAVPRATLERFRHVREEIDEGWRAFLRVQADFAASRLAAARTDAEALVALPGGDVLYADASLRLGAVLGHMGRGAEAQAVLALALALDPERPVTLAEFSPDIVAAVDAVRAQTRPSREVRIASEPPGAMIIVDGVELGLAPVHASLAIGQHVVVARAPQWKAHAQAVAVGEGTAEVAVALERDDEWARLAAGAPLGLADAAAQALVDATIRYAELDDAVVAVETERRGGPTLLVQRCAGEPARCTAVAEVGFGDASGLAAAARTAWQTIRTADLRYPPSVLADPRATGDVVAHRCEVCRSPWLWGGVTLGVVAATVAIIAVASSSRPPPVVGVDPTRF